MSCIMKISLKEPKFINIIDKYKQNRCLNSTKAPSYSVAIFMGDKGLTLETSALKLSVANLHYQLSW